MEFSRGTVQLLGTTTKKAVDVDDNYNLMVTLGTALSYLTDSISTPDTLGTLRTIATFSYAEFPASKTTYLYAINQLTPTAKRRVYLLTSTLDQNLTAVGIQPGYVGSTGLTHFHISTWSNAISPQVSTVTGDNTAWMYFDREIIADSVQLYATVGSIAPTSGNVILQVVEVI